MNVILVMILCLAGSPERCETIRPAEWPARVSLLECSMFGQHFASEWLRLHPSYAEYRRALLALRDGRARLKTARGAAIGRGGRIPWRSRLRSSAGGQRPSILERALTQVPP